MKILITVLASFVMIQATPPQRISFLGDSHCNGGFGLGDSNWLNRTAATINMRDPGSTPFKYCAGGETIRSGMPGWYPGSIAGRNIDAALSSDPDIVLMLYSGNHVAFGIPQDTSKFCYLYLADTLTRLGKRWAFSTIGPRQNTYSNGMDFAKYNAQRDSLNVWLYKTFPGHIFSLDTLLDRTTNKPKAALLLSDSLHYWTVGHRYMWQETMRMPFMDTILMYKSISATNLRFSSSTVTFEGADLKYLDIFGSNDSLSWSRVSHNEYSRNTSYSTGGFKWVKVVASNNRKTITVTKKVL